MHSLSNVEETFNPDFKFPVAPRELWQPAYHRCQPSYHHTQGAAWRPSSHPTPSPAPWAAARPPISGACQQEQEGHHDEGFGNSKMIQCKKQMWLHEQE